MSQRTDMLAELRRTGHRVTPQREMILDALCQSEGHISADEVIRRVRKRYPDINKPAVYRTLELLRDMSLITETDFGQGRIAYELRRCPRHHHLVCRQCRSMIAIDESFFSELESRLSREYGFAANLEHFAIWGMCRKCQGKPMRAESHDPGVTTKKR